VADYGLKENPLLKGRLVYKLAKTLHDKSLTPIHP